MKDGTILLWKSKGFTGWCIRKVTGMPWGHAASYLGGFTFEFTLWWSWGWWRTGVRVTEGLAKAHEYWQTKKPMTEKQKDDELHFWVTRLNARTPYNVPKLLLDVIVYPCRRFFSRIGWIPLDKPIWGENCSSGVDKAKKYAGIDLVPGIKEGATAPGDLRKSPLLEKVGA